jgi:predicted MFS family arabinose efflux permease
MVRASNWWRETRRDRVPLMVAGLGATQTIGWGTTYYLPAVLVDPLIGDLHLSRDGVFGGVTVMLIVAALVGPRAGRLIDRLGPKPLLCAGSLVLAAGLALLAAGRSPGTYYAAWAALGLGVPTGLTIAAHAALVRLSAARARRSIGTLMLFTGLASTIFWPITSSLVHTVGWRPTCFLFAALHLLVCLPIHVLLPYRPGEPAAAEETPTGRPSSAPGLSPADRGKALALVAVAFSLQGTVSWGLTLHLISLFAASGMPVALAVGIAALIGPATVGGRFLDMVLAGRVSAFKCALGALMLMPVAFLILLGAGGSTAAAMVFVLLWGGANGTFAVARATLPLALFGSGEIGRLLGLLSLPQNLFYAVSPLLFSAAIERAGPAAALEFGLVCVVLACAAMLMLARLVGRSGARRA